MDQLFFCTSDGAIWSLHIMERNDEGKPTRFLTRRVRPRELVRPGSHPRLTELLESIYPGYTKEFNHGH